MKILHFSDIENDLVTLDKVTRFAKKRNDLEVVVCSGDILGPVLEPEKMKDLKNSWNTLSKHFSQEDLILNPQKVVKEIRRLRNRQLLAAAKTYGIRAEKVAKSAEEIYPQIARLFRQFPQDVLTVPGNWDVMSYHKYFDGMDIHKLYGEINGVEFAGYGEAIKRTTPPTLSIGYSEPELHKFLNDIVPEIAVTHVPPFMILDEANNGQHIGSRELLNYLANEEGSSNLVLCGHCHEDAGIKIANKAFVINPGNLGKTRKLESPDPGCFVVIDYNTQTKQVDKVTGYQVADDNEVYELNGKGRVRQEVA